MRIKKFSEWINENAQINKTSIDNTGAWIYPPVVGEDDSDYKEGESNYMFFSNLERICELSQMLLSMDREELDSLLNNGHDWANDHVTTAKANLDHVFGFFNNEMKFNKKKAMIESVEGSNNFNRQFTMTPTWWAAWRMENEEKLKLEIIKDNFTKTYQVKDENGKLLFIFDYRRSKIFTNESPEIFSLDDNISAKKMKEIKTKAEEITKPIVVEPEEDKDDKKDKEDNPLGL